MTPANLSAADLAAVRAELDSAADGPITVDISVTGRRSGEVRRTEIWIVNVDGRWVIAGTPGPRDWMANLRADPNLVVHFNETCSVDVEGTAHEVTNPDVRRAIYTHGSTRWYRQRASVDEMVATAPTVELSLSLGG